MSITTTTITKFSDYHYLCANTFKENCHLKIYKSSFKCSIWATTFTEIGHSKMNKIIIADNQIIQNNINITMVYACLCLHIIRPNKHLPI